MGWDIAEAETRDIINVYGGRNALLGRVLREKAGCVLAPRILLQEPDRQLSLDTDRPCPAETKLVGPALGHESALLRKSRPSPPQLHININILQAGPRILRVVCCCK